MKRRVLFVINHAGFFLSHRLPLAQAAQRVGYDVLVATPQSKHVAQIQAAGLPWVPIGLSRSGTNPWTEGTTVVDLLRLYRRFRPALVHHVTPKPVLYGTPVSRVLGVSAVVNAISGMGHAFGQPGRLQSAVSLGYRLALRHPNMRVIFQNEAHLELFVREGWVKSEQCALVRGSGVDTAVFAPRDYPLTGVPLIAMVSRMLRTKGVAEFVEAARLLKADRIEARCVLIGDPDPDNPASISEHQLRAWEAEGSVEYWGRREDIAATLRDAAIACLPTYYPEGVPKSLIEAASCGLPIVTTGIPGCRELVVHGENGLHVPIRQAAPLAAALRTLLADPALRARMGARGRARVLAEYSITNVVAAHLNIYEELLA